MNRDAITTESVMTDPWRQCADSQEGSGEEVRPSTEDRKQLRKATAHHSVCVVFYSYKETQVCADCVSGRGRAAEQPGRNTSK